MPTDYVMHKHSFGTLNLDALAQFEPPPMMLGESRFGRRKNVRKSFPSCGKNLLSRVNACGVC